MHKTSYFKPFKTGMSGSFKDRLSPSREPRQTWKVLIRLW